MENIFLKSRFWDQGNSCIVLCGPIQKRRKKHNALFIHFTLENLQFTQTYNFIHWYINCLSKLRHCFKLNAWSSAPHMSDVCSKVKVQLEKQSLNYSKQERISSIGIWVIWNYDLSKFTSFFTVCAVEIEYAAFKFPDRRNLE